MIASTGLSPVGRGLVYAAAFCVVVAGMRGASALVVPFLLSLFIAVIAAPPLVWMQQKGVPSALAITLLVAVLAVAAFLLVVVIGTSINAFSQRLPDYQERIQTETEELLRWLEGLGFEVHEEAIRESFDPGMVTRLFGALLNGLAVALSNVLIIFLTVFFILIEASGLPAKVAIALRHSPGTRQNLAKMMGNVRRYMALKTAVSAVTGVLIAVWLAILGVDYALMWGLLAFMFNFVPNIGSFIAAIPAVILAFIQVGLGTAVWTAVGFTAVNLSIGALIEPRVMGQGLGLSTLVVFISLVFWGWVLGPVGMLLSAPLTMIVKIMLESSEETRPIALLLGSRVELAHHGGGQAKPDSPDS